MKPGDKVRIDGKTAIVLCDVDAGEYSTEYTADDWADVLKSGILVETVEIGLVHYHDSSEAILISGRRRRGNDVTPTTNPPHAAFAAPQLRSDCGGAAGAGRSSRANFRARRMFVSSELWSKVISLKQCGHCI